jgi:hypothetical protein
VVVGRTVIYENNWMPINGKPVDISSSIPQHLHEKRLEQNAGPNASDIYALHSSTAYTHGHYGTTPPPHQTPSVNPTFTTPANFAPSQLPSAVKNHIGNMEI